MSTAASVSEPVTLRSRTKSPAFALFGLGLLSAAVLGFWPQYFSAVIGATPEPTTQFWLIHLHAALFVAWLLAYVFQASLVLSGHTRVHLKTGPWLAAFGFAIALFGLFAASMLAARFGERMRDFDARASFVFFPIIDMVYFVGFLWAALRFRKRPEIHKRAMFLGWGRFISRLPFDSAWVWQPLTLAPLLALIAYDLGAHRKLYTIVALWLALHLLRLNAEEFVKTDWWLPLGRFLVMLFR